MDSSREDLAVDDLQKICDNNELDHPSLVAAMYDELEIGLGIDSCSTQDLNRQEGSVG